MLSVPITADDLDKMVQGELRRFNQRLEAQAVLESDEAFAVFCAKRSGLPFGPFVRANTYQKLAGQQDIWRDIFGADPRRPVVMRGALARVKGKWSAQTGYAFHVGRRYLLKIRFTAFRREEVDRMRDMIGDHMAKRDHKNSDDCVKAVFCNEKYAQAWIAGELRFIDNPCEWRRLRKLYEHSAAPLEARKKPMPLMTLRQRKTAAYRALQEMGIQF